MLSERLRWAVKHKLETSPELKKITQVKLAEVSELSPTAVSNWFSDKNGMDAEPARRLGSFLGVNPVWLENGEGDPLDAPAGSAGFPVGASKQLQPDRRQISPRSDLLEISIYDVRASMGPGLFAPEYTDVIERISVSAAWLRSQVTFTNPSNLGIITGYGDSMEGTFNDGDPLLVDVGVNQIKIDAVYVLALNDELYIKRLQRRPDGSVLMISDNKKYDPYVIKNGELERFRILGRVLLVWNAKKL